MSQDLWIVALLAVPIFFLVRYVLVRIPLKSCRCLPGSSPWEAKVEDYGLDLTEEGPSKRLRAVRVRARRGAARARRSGARPHTR